MRFREFDIRSIFCLGIILVSQSSTSTFAQSSFVNSEYEAKRRNTIDTRIKRQRFRIREAIEKGTLSEQRAKELRGGLDELEAKVNTQREENGGALKEEQLVNAENNLDQSNEIIKSFEAAGERVVDKSEVLGPTWAPGKDGAQNSGKLINEMKEEAQREERQYKQTMEQKTEQQQLDYEKHTIEDFQKQRNKILEQKTDLENVRQNTGAN